MSHMSTIRLLDTVGESFDSEVKLWKDKIESTLENKDELVRKIRINSQLVGHLRLAV